MNLHIAFTLSGPLLSPHEPMRHPNGVILPFGDHRVEEREVVGAVDIDETAEFDRPRPGVLVEFFEGKNFVVMRLL